MAEKKPDGGNAPTEEGPKYATAEDVNAAFTERAKRLEKQMEARFEAFGTSLMEKIATLTPKAPEQAPGEGKAATTEDADAKIAAKVKEIEARFRKELADRDSKLEAERMSRARDEERNALASALEDAGVSDPVLKRGALALLYSEEKRVTRDKESGAIKFKLPRDGYTDEVSILDGVKEWAKSDDGKRYVPARGAGGSGAAPGAAPSKTPTTKEEKRKAAEAVLAGLLVRR